MGTEVGPVVVDGAGPLASEAVHQLRRVGVRVRAGSLAADAELTGAGPRGAPALVVIVRDRPVPAWAGAPWHLRGVPHLPVADAGTTTVGPLVVPGCSACLACVARQRDAASAPPPDTTPRDDVATRVLGGALVTVTALSVLRGEDTLAGISTEIGPRVETLRHRVWHGDTACRCSSVRMAG